ncbi:NAD(P)-dependent alcohol dehydrogenase [Salicola sp. Rm-C-2C1-2]|uniref:NAD(P)-dependent alcohol dehydrogenase n=1 Tax=Salicola sp. Rm-C-2C1-2 TaxID=3141321 RepID=UPI0032E4ED62
MKAIIYRAYGQPNVLEWVDDWPEPVVGPGQVQVKVRAGALNPKDVLLRKGFFRSFLRVLDRESLPRVSGLDMAGEVVRVGDQVRGLEVGQRVFGMSNRFHGGVHAEYAVLEADEVIACPEGLAFTEASAIPLAGLTALQALRDCAGVQPGQRVLINGASGGVGHFAVQIARNLGCHVIAVCSERNLKFVTDLGANEAVDYHQTPAPAIPGPFDVVFDVFGNYSVRDFSNSLSRGGRYVSTIPSSRSLPAEGLARLGLHKRSRLVIVHSNRSDLAVLRQWANEGKLRVHVDQIYPFYHAEDAHRHIETRHTRGKVVMEATC